MPDKKFSIIVIYNNNEDKIKSLIENINKLSLKDFEIIFVNNGSSDGSAEIVGRYAKEHPDIKMIYLPERIEEERAKASGLGIAGGEFVYFVNAGDCTDINADDFDTVKKYSQIKLINNKLYRRNSLENNDDIVALAEQKVSEETEKIRNLSEEKFQKYKEETEKLLLKHFENFDGKIYNTMCRFDILEKFVYERENENKENFAKLNEISENLCKTDVETLNQVIRSNADEIYGYIKSENEKFQNQINMLFEKIENINNENDNRSGYNGISAEEFNIKTEELKKEIIIRHSNLKRMNDIRFDEIEAMIKSYVNSGNEVQKSDIESEEIRKYVNESLDKVYVSLNKISELFYKELSGFYVEVNNRTGKIGNE